MPPPPPGNRPRRPGDPGEGHWAHPFYEKFRLYLEGARNLSAPTVRNYLQDLLPFWRFLDGEGVASLEGVSRDLLRRYIYWLFTEAKVERRRGRPRRDGYAPRSVARKVSALRALFRFLHRHGLLPSDPTARLDRLRVERRLPVFLDLPSVLALLRTPRGDTPQGVRDRAVLELLYASGLRVSEMARLKVGDVDVKGRAVRVMGKGNKERVVPFGVPAQEALDRYLQWARPRLQGPRSGEALFLNRFGAPLSPRSLQALVQRYARRAGVDPRTHPHTLRHTFATHLMDGGADLRVVQELLGHASPVTTQVYTHVSQASARQAYLQAHPRARKGPSPGTAG